MENKAFRLSHVGFAITLGVLLNASVFLIPAFAAEGPRIDSFRTTAPSMSATNPMIFSWQAKNADSCSAFGGWSGTKGVTGNEKVAAPTETTTYGLQCTRAGQTAAAQFQILVNPTQITFDFTQVQQYALIPTNSSVQLIWRGLPTNGVCSLDASGMRLAASGDGSQAISLPSEGTYTYTLDCKSAGRNIASPTITLTTYAPEKSRTVNSTHAKDGDRAGKFQIASIQALNPSNPKDPYADRVSPSNVRVDMRGRATVTGVYHYFPNTYGTVTERNRICMTDFDGASEQQLPALLGSEKAGSRFCFNNGDAAARLLGAEPGTSGTATVVIDGYTLIGDSAQRPDETYLLNVSAHRQTAPIKVTVAEPKKPALPNNPQGQPVIVYLQPNQKLQIIDSTSVKKIAPLKRTVVKKPARKRAALRQMKPKPKAAAKSTSLQPPKGKSTIKKVVPKANAQRTEAPQPKAKQITRLYDAYIN